MSHQDWEPTVLKKTNSKPNSIKPKTDKPNVQEALDVSEPIKFFTPSMGKKIASLRTEQKLTQEQLAQKLCISKQVIQSLEQGKEKYNGNLVSKLKRVLGNFDW